MSNTTQPKKGTSWMSNEQRRRKDRMDSWRFVFEKTNRILSGRSDIAVKVSGVSKVGPLSGVPGWSDGTTITFNADMMDHMLEHCDPVSAVLRMKGLNYHELSHVLFTPRFYEAVPSWVRRMVQSSDDFGWWYAFNGLEDQRIETAFYGMYRPAGRYFEAAVLEWMVGNPQSGPEAFCLTYGRKYLSPRLRVQLEADFVAVHGQALADALKDVIDRYLTVIPQDDVTLSYRLIEEYKTLLDMVQSQAQSGMPDLPVNDNGMEQKDEASCGIGPSSTTCEQGSAADPNERREASEKNAEIVEKSKEADEQERERRAKDEAEAEADEQPGNGTEGDDAEGDDAEGTEGDGTDDTEGDAAEGDDAEGGTGSEGSGVEAEAEGGPSQDEPESGGAGSGGSKADDAEGGEAGGQSDDGDPSPGGVGSGAGLRQPVQSLEDIVLEELEEVHNDPNITQDVKRVLASVRAASLGNVRPADGAKLVTRGTASPTSQAIQASNKIGQMIGQIKQGAESEILRGVRAGRLDVRKMLGAQPNDLDVFNVYDEGIEDELGMEAVLLVDVSGSMAGTSINEASKAIWALKRAFDKNGIRCSVFAFDDEHYVVYQAAERAKNQVVMLRECGGTNPLSALKQAYSVLARSTEPSKVLVTITDGGWDCDDEDDVKPIMDALHGVGVHSLNLSLGGIRAYYGDHEHRMGADIQRVSDIPKVVAALVEQIMKNVVAQH